MKPLTDKEEELMNKLWENGPMYVRELVESYPDPKPHFNTVSTFIRLLEQKGYVSHEKIGGSYRYAPLVTRNDYSGLTLRGVVKRYFNNSLSGVISTLVKEERLTDAEIAELIEIVRCNNASDGKE